VVALALLLALGVFLTARLVRPPGVDRSLQRVQQAGVLVVGLDPSYPPFEVVNGQGQLAGYDIDLATELARRLGVRVQFVSVDFGGIFDALQVAKFDVMLGGVSPSSDDAKTVGWSVPYFDDGLVLVENRNAPGKVVGYESGSDADLDQDQLRRDLPAYHLQQFDDQDQIHALLAKGAVRGAIVDAVTGITWSREDSALAVTTKPMTSVPYVVATRLGDQALLHAVDRALQSLKADGFTQRLQQQWLK
jgi:polar amino acid transport system substrate-binding protein